MPTSRSTSDSRTLYRLQREAASIDDILGLLDAKFLDELGAQIDFPDLGIDVPAVLIQAQWPVLQASWCEQASMTTGVPVTGLHQESGALLVFAVDSHLYVLVYGDGHRLVPDELKDQRFGLRFVARTIDTEKVNTFTRRSLGRGGRTDITHVAAGAPWWMLSMHAELQVVRNLGGKATGNFRLTCTGNRARPVTLHGGVGLRARFGLDGADLIADVREIARVLRDLAPAPGLEVIDHLAPVAEAPVLIHLEGDLEARLGRGEAAGITLVAPDEHQSAWQDAKMFRLRIGSVSSAAFTPEPVLGEVIRRAVTQPPGTRVTALKRGAVEIYGDHRGQERRAILQPYKCLEVETPVGSRRFALMEGHWYELDADYLEVRRIRIRALFPQQPTLDLPGWNRQDHRREEDYCITLLGAIDGFVNLDQKTIHNPIRPTTGTLEICDALAPDDALVLVKRAESAKPLSHLFWQGINAAQALIGYPTARIEFAALVARHGAGRIIPPDFIPKKIAFAILHEHNRPITAETLPPFALLALATTADILNGLGIEVEVISISPCGDEQ